MTKMTTKQKVLARVAELDGVVSVGMIGTVLALTLDERRKATAKATVAKTTIRAIVVRVWSTESRFGVSYFFQLRPVDGSNEFTSTIIEEA